MKRRYEKIYDKRLPVSPMMLSQAITTLLLILSINITHATQISYLRNCYIRYDVVHFLNHTCEEVYANQPHCKNTLDIAYYSFPPYIFKNKSGNVQGLLPGFFQKFYVDTCCLGCGKIRYLPAKSRRSMIVDQVSPDKSKQAGIVLPIQNCRKSESYFGKPFTEAFHISHVYYTGVLDEVEPANKMTSLFMSLVLTWPLLLMTMSMAFGAGALMWVLDGRFNKKQFPPNFPNGLLEGIWWAFISMTTVGYGDRTPSSAWARVFAVFWIFFGITFFAMYLGTITSVMTKNLYEKPEFEVSGKRVGLLSWNNAAKQSLVVSDGVAAEFNNVEDMIEAFADKRIHAIAMDYWMTKFYLPRIRQSEPEAAVQLHLTALESGIGFLSIDNTVKNLCKNFLKQNMDNVNEIWMDVANDFAQQSSLELLKDKDIFQKHTHEIETMFTYQHISFPICLISMVVLVCLCVFINSVVNRKYIAKQAQDLKNAKGESNSR